MAVIRPLEPADAAVWLAMRRELWPESSEAEHRDEIDQFLAGRSLEPAAVLLAEDVDARPLGFAELSVRHYAEGCRTQRVAYLEGWFVRPGTRQRGVGRDLVAAAEAWGRDQGCIEFASDADPDNTVSIAAHRALGFDDVGLVRCFRKNL